MAAVAFCFNKPIYRKRHARRPKDPRRPPRKPDKLKPIPAYKYDDG
jgi:hypothetical protein